MKIDLHIHSRHSDGALTVKEIVSAAEHRNIEFMSITDHDSIECQGMAIGLAKKAGIRYISGVELNVTFLHTKLRKRKPVSLDFLGYKFDEKNSALSEKLRKIKNYRKKRIATILSNLNSEFEKEEIEKLTWSDFESIRTSVDGVIGRPHIADFLVKKGIVRTRKEAFNRYLVKCNVSKYPLYIEEASRLVRSAGGMLILAHPNDPYGTSLITLTKSLTEQTAIIEKNLLEYIDGVECWHSRGDFQTANHYVKFAEEHGLTMTGGSDCHQNPILMGTVEVPEFVANQFDK